MKIQIYHVQWIPFIRLLLDTVVEIQQTGDTGFSFTESTPALFQQTVIIFVLSDLIDPAILPRDVRLFGLYFPASSLKPSFVEGKLPFFSGTMAVCDDRLHIFVFKFHIWELLDECHLVLVTSWHQTCLFSLILSVCLLIDLVPSSNLIKECSGCRNQTFSARKNNANKYLSLSCMGLYFTMSAALHTFVI